MFMQIIDAFGHIKKAGHSKRPDNISQITTSMLALGLLTGAYTEYIHAGFGCAQPADDCSR